MSLKGVKLTSEGHAHLRQLVRGLQHLGVLLFQGELHGVRHVYELAGSSLCTYLPNLNQFLAKNKKHHMFLLNLKQKVPKMHIFLIQPHPLKKQMEASLLPKHILEA